MKAEMHDSYGFYIVIYHGGGLRTLYAHCDMLLVAAGQNVKAGEQIATVGGTGNVSGSLCHFEVQLDGAVVDPEDYVTLPPEMQLP